MLKKLILFSILCISCNIVMIAQQKSRSLPFLEVNPNIRSAGMGNAAMGQTNGMFIYNNPAAFFNIDENIYGSYSLTLYPKINGMGSNMFHSLSGGYKLGDKHAIMIGARYLGGIKINRKDANGNERKPIKPLDLSVDVEYAFKATDNFAFYLGGSFIESYNSKGAFAGGFNLGACYNNYFGDKYHYSINADIKDLGTKIKYGSNGTEYDLPASAGLGGTIDFPINDNHNISTAIMGRYYFLPSDASSFTSGIGAEYGFKKMLFVRGGYHTGDNNNYYTVGLGGKYKFVEMDVAYTITSENKFNLISVGLNIKL